MSKTVKASSVDIIMESKKYVARMNDIMRSIYMGEYVTVKHQDFENSEVTVDKTGEICYIHPKNTYFNVKFDDTGIAESYYPSDVSNGTVRLHSEGGFEYSLIPTVPR